MSVTVKQVEGMKLVAEYEGFEIISGRVDEATPPEGMSPGRLMVASLGLCTGLHVLWYLRRHEIKHEDLTITVVPENERGPARCSECTVNIDLKADLTEREVKGLMAEANRCYVSNTMRGRPTINFNLIS
jgi:uncharacterized OsmC-like protein